MVKISEVIILTGNCLPRLQFHQIVYTHTFWAGLIPSVGPSF